MPVTRHAHTVDPVYASPVLRAPSPTDTISTEYGPDETSEADKMLSNEEFAKKVEEEIGLRKSKWSEAGPVKPIILPRSKDAKEEQAMFERVLTNLRAEVKKLEEEDMFNFHPLKSSNNSALEEWCTSRDLDAIMKNMMISLPPQSPQRIPSPSSPDPSSKMNGIMSRMKSTRNH